MTVHVFAFLENPNLKITFLCKKWIMEFTIEHNGALLKLEWVFLNLSELLKIGIPPIFHPEGSLWGFWRCSPHIPSYLPHIMSSDYKIFLKWDWMWQSSVTSSGPFPSNTKVMDVHKWDFLPFENTWIPPVLLTMPLARNTVIDT